MIEVDITKRLESVQGPFELTVKCTLLAGRIVSFFGKSGAGKTSLLRMIAGLMPPDSGTIKVNGEHWFQQSKSINIRPQNRNVGFVMQENGLFPHMTLEQNIRFAQPNGRSQHEVAHLLEDFGLTKLKDEMPGRLSGGQKQLAVLAQTLVRRPKVLLLDEPLSALDEKMRDQMQAYILRTQAELNLTTVLVSHDIREVIRLADEVFILEDGHITKHGHPSHIFFPTLQDDFFQMSGEIIEIGSAEDPNLLLVLVGDKLIKVSASESQIKGLKPGDSIQMTEQAFRPNISKI